MKKNGQTSSQQKQRQIFYDSKFNKPVGIPNEENMFKLNKYLVDNETEMVNTNFVKTKYMEVVKCTLAHVIVFNRRRCGEVQRLLIQDYLTKEKSNTPQGEIEVILSEKDKRRSRALVKS